MIVFKVCDCEGAKIRSVVHWDGGVHIQCGTCEKEFEPKGLKTIRQEFVDQLELFTSNVREGDHYTWYEEMVEMEKLVRMHEKTMKEAGIFEDKHGFLGFKP